MAGYRVDAFEVFTTMVGGDYRTNPASTSGEPDAYIGDFATSDEALAAATAWMAEHPAHLDDLCIAHHKVNVYEMVQDEDGDLYGDKCEALDTIDADKARLYRDLLDSEDPDLIYEER